jgi:hypothetical protein
VGVAVIRFPGRSFHAEAAYYCARIPKISTPKFSPGPGAEDLILRKTDGREKNRFADDFVKSSKFKARESRVTRRTYRTPQ